MKYLGNIVEGKDLTNKDYVDKADAALDEIKLEESDLLEISNTRLLSTMHILFNKVHK